MEAPGSCDRLLAAVLSEAERDPRLVRNYDYPAELMDAVILRSTFVDRTVIGVTGALWGLRDG